MIRLSSLLLAISLVAVAVTMTTIQPVSANTTDNLFADFRSDIHDLIFSGNYTWEQAKDIQHIHDAELEQIIDQIEIGKNERMDPQSREGLKEYMLLEEIKHQQLLHDKSRVIDSTQGSEIETNDPELFGYFFPAAFADCDKQSELVYFRQS